jgi:hypothetical protein
MVSTPASYTVVPDSNLCLETGYPDKYYFVVFSLFSFNKIVRTTLSNEPTDQQQIGGTVLLGKLTVSHAVIFGS